MGWPCYCGGGGRLLIDCLVSSTHQDLAGKQAALESALADAKAERSAAEAESQQQVGVQTTR